MVTGGGGRWKMGKSAVDEGGASWAKGEPIFENDMKNQITKRAMTGEVLVANLLWGTMDGRGGGGEGGGGPRKGVGIVVGRRGVKGVGLESCVGG